MLFDSVTLNKNQWHYKLQEWMFGSVPFTSNFCPYFWLTIFCVLMTPFKLLWLGFKWTAIFALGVLVAPFALVHAGFEWLTKFLDLKFFKPRYEQRIITFVEGLSDEAAYFLATKLFTDEAFDFTQEDYYQREASLGPYFASDVAPLALRVEAGMYDNYGYSDKAEERLKHDIRAWVMWKERAGEGWEERLRTAREAYQERKRLAEEAAEAAAKANADAERRRKQFFSKLVQYTKYLVALAVGIPAIYVTYWLALLGLVIVENWAGIVGFFASVISFIWHGVSNGGPWVLLAIAGIAVIAMTIKLLVFSTKKFVAAPSVKQATAKASSGVGFLTTYLKTFKENHCPAIEWETETSDA